MFLCGDGKTSYSVDIFSYSGPLGILVLMEIKLVLGCVRIVALSTSSLMNRLSDATGLSAVCDCGIS